MRVALPFSFAVTVALTVMLLAYAPPPLLAQCVGGYPVALSAPRGAAVDSTYLADLVRSVAFRWEVPSTPALTDAPPGAPLGR